MVEGKIQFYSDRMLVKKLPDQLKQLMYSQFLLADDDQVVSFCGLVICDSALNIFFPRNSMLPEVGSKDGVRNASLLMKAISMYVRENKSRLYAFDEGADNAGNDRFSLILDLLEDYCKNGIYSRRYKEKVRNTGKPDWKQTISSETPFPSAKGPVYTEICGIRRRYVSNCEVARIHSKIIKELDDKYGWLITGSEKSVAQEIRNSPPPVGNYRMWLRRIRNEKNDTYSAREIRLLELLSAYLEKENGREQGTSIIGLRYFQGMWEHMLDRTLMWKFEVNRYLSVPSYRLADGTLQEAAAKGQRTDTVLRKPQSECYAVVDAKYYAAQGVATAPGWPDLVKQFFYAKALEVYSPGATINNAFIFPGDGPLRSVHMKKRGKKETEDKDYAPIICLYQDPISLLGHYVHRKKIEALSFKLFTG